MYIRIRKSLLWLIVAFISPVVLISCGEGESSQQQGPAQQALSVGAYTVKKQDVTGTDTYPGTVVPLNEVALRPQVSGYITNIYVEDGQQVTKGQKLYEIDRSKYQAAYQQAQANLQSARANLQRVQKDVERYERLSEQEAIAQQQLDYARTDLQTAKAQLASAEAQVQSAATDLSYAVINAPFSGSIGISQVRIGAQVSPGQPLLNTISSENPIAVDIVINEQEIPRFTRLRDSKPADSTFMLKLANGETYRHPGTLAAIDRAVNRQTGTITVRLTFPNPERRLIAGMTVRVNVLNQDIGNQLVIPYKAVSEQLGEFYVYVVEEGVAHQQNVTLGTRFGADIVVREGLEEGDVIVVEGFQRLREGSEVQIADK
jgi:membrane fusion protein (multidrug efflux system)